MSELALPAKPDLEKLVLGAVQMDGSRYELVREALTREDFTSEKHRQLWGAFGALHERGVSIDRVTVWHALSEIAPGSWTLGELVSLDDDLPKIPALDSYVQILADIGRRRKAIFTLGDLARKLAAGDDTGAALQRAEGIIRGLSDNGSEGTPKGFGAIVEAAGGLDSVMRPHEFTPATPMPWASLCQIFAGLGPGQLTILAGRPGDGKSTMALQILHHAASLGTPVAVFSLEMSGLEILRRLACLLAEVPLQRFLRGFASREEQSTIARTMGELAASPISIDDGANRTVGGIRRAITRMKRPPRIIAVDYLQLLSSSGRSRQRYEELGEITRGLKLLAIETQASVLCLSQLTRANEHEKRAPELRDLRESGSIEQDADSVIMLHHVGGYEQRGADHLVKVYIRKQRLGPIGECSLVWNSRVARFDDEKGGM